MGGTLNIALFNVNILYEPNSWYTITCLWYTIGSPIIKNSSTNTDSKYSLV